MTHTNFSMSKMIPEMGPVYQFAKFIPLLAAATGILAYNSYKEGSLEDVRAERPLGERLRHDEGVSGGGGKVPRLRRRSKWVCRTVDALGIQEGTLGKLFAGRWIPDLTGEGDFDVADWLSALVDGGAKVIGGGFCKQSDPEKVQQPFVKLLLGRDVVCILPGLVARLALYSVYRKRSLLSFPLYALVLWSGAVSSVLRITSLVCSLPVLSRWPISGPRVSKQVSIFFRLLRPIGPGGG